MGEQLLQLWSLTFREALCLVINHVEQGAHISLSTGSHKLCGKPSSASPVRIYSFLLFVLIHFFFGTCFNYDTNLHYNLIIIYFLSQRAIVDAVGTHPDVFYQPVHPSPSCCKRWLLMAAISFFQRILLLQRYKQSILCLKVGALCHVIHIAELPVVSLRTRLQETIAEPTSSPSFIL